MTIDELFEQLNENVIVMEEYLNKYCPKDENADVLNAVEYSLYSSGKRLRAFLVLNAAKRYGIMDENIERLAVAIEMIHTYSLVHDDLPCMDDDDTRRGKPSNHKVYGEAGAVLAGDCLLNMAFEVMLGGNITNGYVKAMRAIAAYSGYKGMVGGQYLELINPLGNIGTLLQIAKGKTSALISAATVAVAYYAERSEKEIKLLLEFSENFGIAFQISDDILDYYEEMKCAATITGKYELPYEFNFISFFGMDESKNLLNYYTNLAKSALKSLKLEGCAEDALLDYNISREF